MDHAAVERALHEAVTIAEDAGSVLLGGYRTELTVRKKGRIDLITAYDLRCEELIRKRLAAAFPDHAIVGEEGEDQGGGPYVWYVDPLDGTTNFAHGHPFFCVSIGLCHGPEPLVGVVAAPALAVTWTAGRGLGATRNGRPCRVSQCGDLADALCATGFPYDRQETDDDNTTEHRAFLKHTQGIRRCGSAAIDLALVADGTYDVYWEQRLSAWDMSAGACLVVEAGGRISDYDGGRADPRSGRLVATNGRLHDDAIALLSRSRYRSPAGRPSDR
jgi:myo-inositol-1(or 4)-monophosphatase